MPVHVPAVLDNASLKRIAPSIFASRPYEGMSDKYSFIPTSAVLDELRGKGWLPVKAREQKARNEEKLGFTKHMIRLRKSDAPVMVGETLAEIVLVNAHDGGAAFQLYAGLFRLVCSNGLTVDEGSIERISIRHSGDVIGEVAYAAKHIAKDAPRLAGEVKRMQAIELQSSHQRSFAAAALDLKYESDEHDRSLAPITPDQILVPRRLADKGNDLWTTFNVVQENLIKGGLRGRSQSKTNRRVRTREVQSVSEDIRLNRALWTLARELKKKTR
ncbi:DUF932 domain-containing protein [Geobacter hydrogenophilus]|uniref:DUF945 domain-containing protein n=1 Tax=Geobacter hydrogenophilus TaxID=40983 RepID=A0A9W6FZR1_9BACT|nr:DUF932 domain-containing protein [Geobacter hydrogenophilus]MBT0893547.1 DUF932 domain-containing protein [Geobacter hydrogenophilus]GLI37758.1 hypothetical protein GHYDROH2_12590 [Geobacter hydrogenophilus]